MIISLSLGGIINQELLVLPLWFSLFLCYRAVLLWCHRAPSPRSQWGPSRPVLSAGTLTLLQSLLVLELPQSEWLDLELVLGQCLVASSLAMQGWLWYDLTLTLLQHTLLFSDVLTDDYFYLFAGTHLWSSSCFHTPFWGLLFLKPWDCSVWWLLSLSCLLCKTSVIQNFDYQCDYMFYCGYQNCTVLVSWKCTFSNLSGTVKIKTCIVQM